MVKAFVFDAYGTLFDVHSVKEECNKWFPEKGDAISTTWREKQLNYFFFRIFLETDKFVFPLIGSIIVSIMIVRIFLIKP